MQKRHQDFQDDLTQIDEDENESSKNVYSNMKKLGNSQYFSNPSRLQKQKIPDFEPRPNDLNALVSSNQLRAIQFPGSMTSTNESSQQKLGFQQYNRNGSQPSIYSINNFQNNSQQQQSNIENGNNYKSSTNSHHKHNHHHHHHQSQGVAGYAEENINDNDFSSSEFDVSENEAIGPSHNINQSILNQYKNTFFNQKIKEFNERKARCHTLLPKQAQKYFRDHKTTKSYIQHSPIKIIDDTDQLLNIKGGGSTKRIQDTSIDEFQGQNTSIKPQRNKSAMVNRVTSNENINNTNKRNDQIDDYLSKKLQPSDMNILQQQSLQNQIAQQLPQSVLDANKFNLNFNVQQQNSQIQQMRKQSYQTLTNSKEFKNTSNTPTNSLNGAKQQQHNIPNPQMKISSNELSKLIQLNNSPLVNSQTPTSQFSTQIGGNRQSSFTSSQHKQVKEEVIQKQIVKSQQIQAKLEEQSKNIEEKKAAFQDQIFKKVNGLQMKADTTNSIYTINNNQSNSIQNQYTKIQQQITSAPQSTKATQQISSYNKQSSTSTDKHLAPSKLPSMVSPNQRQEQVFQDVDSLNVRQSYNSGINHLGSSITDLAPDAQSRSSVSQKQGFEKQSSFKMQQLQNNFQNQQFLQTTVDGPNRKSKRSLVNDHDLLGFPENETFAGTINTIDVRVDTQTVKTAKVVDKKEQSRLIDSELYDSLIRTIFSSNIQLIESILKRQNINFIQIGIANEERYHIMNLIDEKGNTPLLLAVKLAYSNPNYYTIVKLLLKHDADPRIRDKQDWSCFEEVASQKDFQLASLLFENLINFKKKSLLTQKREIDNMLLSDVPDFYMEMKWEFESNLIPFVSKIAPSDTFKIWKYGRSVRCDSTFAGIQKYRAKRRAQSLIFNCLNLGSKNIQAQTDFDFLTIIHKEEKTFHFPLQELDLEEKKKIMQDLLSSSESIQGNLKVEKTTINPSKSFFGSKQTQKVQGYKCDKYDLQLRYRYMIFKKTRIPFLKNYDKYMVSNTDLSPTKTLISPHDASYLSDRKNESFQNPISCQTSMKEIKINGIDNGNPFEIQITETNKNEIKKQTLGLYVSEEFPMKFKVFMPLLQFLSNGNQLLMNLYEVFKDPSVNETIIKKGFPVKVQIPLSYSIYANITFSQYKPLSTYENENITSLFNIPNDSVFMNRKEKQNTMKKQKKRLMLANLYLS